MKSTPCINCDHEVTGNYCQYCGQRNDVKRITLKEGWNDFWSRLYGFDGMFPRTLRDLSLRPGTVAREFIKGNRTRYYGPVGYFFLMITVMFLTSSLLNIDFIEFLRNSGRLTVKGQEQFIQLVYQKVSDNLKLFSFTIILIQGFCSRYLFFRISGYNYVEHLVLPLYTQGHIYWVSIVSLIVYAVTGSFLSPIFFTVLSIGFTCYAYSNFFAHNKPLKSFLKGLGLVLTSQLIFSLVIAFIFLVLVLMNEELRELIQLPNKQ